MTIPITVSIFFLLAGALLGALIAYLIGKSSRTVLADRKAALEQELVSARVALDRADSENRSLVEAKTELATKLDDERKNAAEKLKLLSDASEQLRVQFKALAATALESNNTSFLELAKSTLERYQAEARRELEKRETAVETLVKPISESLKQVDEQVRQMEKVRAQAHGTLTSQVASLIETQRALQTETGNLVRAMREPQARGRWGELQLRKVLELSGMLDRCDFQEQVTLTGEDSDGRKRVQRPDVVVHLPGDKQIVIDSKVPLVSYLAALEAQDEAGRSAQLAAHARQVKQHIDTLAAKSYWVQLSCTPEFVVLFLPGEVFFRAAMDADPELIEYGVRQKVIVASPTTLIALLKAVAYGWNQKNLADSARQISEAGKRLYERLCTMTGYFRDVGDRLNGAVGAYNKAVGSMERRVFPVARKFPELDRSLAADQLEDLQHVEKTPGQLEAADWEEPPQEQQLPFHGEKADSTGA